MGDDWTAKKLEVLVDVPDALDLEPLRGRGPQPGEALQPDAPAAAAGGAEAAAPPERANPNPTPAQLEPDPGIVAALVGMGFSENGSKRAALATQVRPVFRSRVRVGCEGTRRCGRVHRGF